MSFIVDNDSWNYGGIILIDTTLAQWNRTYYDIFTTTGNITITLPAVPDIFNDVESGLLCFRRVDSNMTNTVTIVADIGGFPTDIPIYPNPNAMHKFRSVYDPTGNLARSTLYDVEIQDIGSASDRVQRDSVDTVAFTNLDVNANNYIGLIVSGWTLAADNSLLLTGQTNAYENGVYKVTPFGYIVHRKTETLGSDGKYHTFPVMRGDAAGVVFRITNTQNVEAPAIYGTSQLSIEVYTAPLPNEAARVIKAVAETESNSNEDITLTNYIGRNIGGFVVNVGDSVLLGNQTNKIENAVYVVQAGGGVLRRKDFQVGTNLDSYIVPITLGNSAGKVVVFADAALGQGNPVIAGFDQVDARSYISTAGSTYTAGTGLTLTGSTFSITPQTASRVIVSDGSGHLSSSSVTSTTLDYVDATSSIQTQLNSKASIAQSERTVKVVSTATFTLSGATSIDNITVNPGDEVLIARTTADVLNGIWTVQSGAWTRSTQMPASTDPFKAKIFVSQGLQNNGSIWSCTNASGSSVGTTALSISKLSPSVLTGLYTTLTTTIGSTDTTINVASTNGFSSYGLVMIGVETISYSGKSATQLTGCTRGVNGTTAASQSINTYVQFLSEEVPYFKSGADFTVSANPLRVYRGLLWMSGSSSTARTWYPSNAPWVYANINAAELSCVYWIQKLTEFFKGLENDSQYDQLIGALPSFIVSRITNNPPQLPDSGTDMDNTVGVGAVTYSSEWFELIVGRNPAANELYTMSFTIALVGGSSYDPSTLHPFRIIWQTTRGASMTGFSGQGVTPIAGAAPKCTAYGTGGVTIPTPGFPLWAVPVSLESAY